MEGASKDEQQQQAAGAAGGSCRRTKVDPNASFFEDVKEHFNEFVTASMEDHKNCFKRTLNKMFARGPEEAKPAQASDQAPVESALPLQVSTSK